MSKRRSPLQRARARLRKKLARGWERAVFATPRAEDGSREERVIEGPGALAADDPSAVARFDALIEAAEAAATEGLVKQTFVIDAQVRLLLDTRHGHLEVRSLDEAKIEKMMGGKERRLRPDGSADLLRVIGIMNADGTISARNAKKYKQVNHLVELCRPVWARQLSERPGQPFRVVDLACGTSYLSFVLLEALRVEGIEAQLLGLDRREDVIETSRRRAEELGLGERARFEVRALEEVGGAEALERELGGPVDLALSLHACDTATDAALSLAIGASARSILCVPCCQAELARQLGERAGPARGAPLGAAAAAMGPAALEHGLLRRAYGDLLTDSLRVEMLEACGYEVAVVEFVASAHTPKNLLLRATRGGRRPPQDWPLKELRQRCEALGVEPTLLRVLSERAAS